MLQKRLQMKRGLKKELAQKQEVFQNLKSREEWLAEFESVVDAAKKADQALVLKLIGLYRRLHRDVSGKEEQQVVLGILLLYFWGDMQFLRNDKEIRAKLFRIGDPFAEIYFAYMILMAEGDFNKPLSEGKVIREIFAEQAREFIKEEFRRQCVYRI
jgi:hypothetical protein